ncbi:MAG: bifunctional diaminohydroxyphosphoribosylaminopyrimidine deaminase/5-amino-6-(5-phosphoribosylamino)uracil reductase RibD [Nitrosomonadales bacterium]|nr:bifunctional diaminohydroxyphosphoribosylaminopyrimidine deaminase/5-amino-6-(5-phosphoribosylamino)uracil reductase RibD [Nitrosomonadales bacterium]
MQQALTLAEIGLYTTMPNPRVGCVIVKDGVVVGRGAHLHVGEPHAEIYALREAGELARGADVYVTLEPCSHYGRTPPCADALITAGVKRVIAAMQDPNPKVAGTGLDGLKSQGIEVASGLLEAEAQALNPGFISRMTSGLPFVRSKIAASLDGRTALANGVSQWITGDKARADVQQWRARSCAIMTGVCTVLLDDPQMNVRRPDLFEIKSGKQPLRVVVDSRLRIAPHAKILEGGNTLVAYATDVDGKKQALESAGATLICLPGDDGRVNLKKLLQHLASLEINEVLVEAGQGLNGALQQAELIDEYLFYYAPLLMGGEARGMFALPSMTEMSQRIDLEILSMDKLGDDIRIRARPRR